jgi:signal transduction histidine kinase/ActR/RegA family two-component response regulator
MLESADNHWQEASLRFLSGLYLIKWERTINVLYAQSADFLLQCSGAKAVAYIQLEDKLTARVLYTNGGAELGAFVDVRLVTDIIHNENPVITTDDIWSGAKGRTVWLPARVNGFESAFIMLLPDNFDTDKGFQVFLEHASLGLRSVVMLIQNYYSIDQLTTRFNSILETIPQGVLFVDEVGKRGWVNVRAAELLRINPYENEPRIISEAMHTLRSKAKNAETILEQSRSFFENGRQVVRNWEWIFTKPSIMVLSVSSTPTISQSGGNGRLWVFTDITQQYVANKQLEKLNKELEKKKDLADAQNAAKSTFLANMSHEIRNPLNGIIGLASLLVSTELNAEQKEYTTGIQVSSSILLELLNDILDMSKIEAGKIDIEEAVFSVSQVTREACHLLQAKAVEKNLSLHCKISEDVPEQVTGDITRLRQVLTNLLSNAVKFTEQGDVLLQVKLLDSHADGYRIEFAVADTGIGIPKDKLDRLFNNFSQIDSSTTRKYGGTGLGLAICKKLVELMGGDIYVQTEEGRGSCFIFTITAGKVTNAVTEGIPLMTEEHQHRVVSGKLKILVVDDTAINRKLVGKMMEKLGQEVDIRSDGKQALEAALARKYDLILMDVMMPEMDGPTAAKKIKAARNEDLPVIVAMTADAFVNDREVLDEMGMDDYIGKPFTLNDLKEKLDSWAAKLAGKSVTS